MPSLNKVFLIGNVGQEPKTVQTRNGGMLTNLTVATSRFYKDAQGEHVEETEWHRVVVFGKSAEYAARLRKGGLVYVEGRLNTSKYTDKDGKDRYQTKIVAEQISSLEKREGQAQQESAGQTSYQQDEDVPF